MSVRYDQQVNGWHLDQYSGTKIKKRHKGLMPLVVQLPATGCAAVSFSDVITSYYFNTARPSLLALAMRCCKQIMHSIV